MFLRSDIWRRFPIWRRVNPLDTTPYEYCHRSAHPTDAGHLLWEQCAEEVAIRFLVVEPVSTSPSQVLSQGCELHRRLLRRFWPILHPSGAYDKSMSSPVLLVTPIRFTSR